MQSGRASLHYSREGSANRAMLGLRARVQRAHTCEEWNDGGGDIEWQGFCAPQQGDKSQQGCTVLFLRPVKDLHICTTPPSIMHNETLTVYK